ncbi:unnamed protein product [Vitrella brassicaformis CCMP3155]|uniref:DUF7869 domain-containing protein n=2 Tax=Vitrella brassicaformis TaxID=1169539 RepID=A0A0G4GHQ9_VITBC|nr:unnamed protein product [Vitrella brassicaformis CCMP3155]|eukprot:CEM29264.1 unnamed protein product [Vitrella brassicaformis CCMP3155]
MDNCTGENKNQYIFAYASLPVHLGAFKEVTVNFLPVGHTHEDIDQLHSVTSKTLRVSRFATATQLRELILGAHRNPKYPNGMQVRFMTQTWDWKALLEPHTDPPVNFCTAQSYRFARLPPSYEHVGMYFKSLIADRDWKGPLPFMKSYPPAGSGASVAATEDLLNPGANSRRDPDRMNKTMSATLAALDKLPDQLRYRDQTPMFTREDVSFCKDLITGNYEKENTPFRLPAKMHDSSFAADSLFTSTSSLYKIDSGARTIDSGMLASVFDRLGLKCQSVSVGDPTGVSTADQRTLAMWESRAEDPQKGDMVLIDPDREDMADGDASPAWVGQFIEDAESAGDGLPLASIWWYEGRGPLNGWSPKGHFEPAMRVAPSKSKRRKQVTAEPWRQSIPKGSILLAGYQLTKNNRLPSVVREFVFRLREMEALNEENLPDGKDDCVDCVEEEDAV